MPLTEQKIQILHTPIERRRAQLLAELPGDASVATLIADLDQAELGRDLSELRDLEAARARLADGSYGICIDCAREIGFERLKANPAALRCIADQTRYELTHGASTGPSL